MKHALTAALIILTALLPGLATAADMQAERITITEWKAVFAKIEARNTIPARSRLGGTLEQVMVAEGSEVAEGQQIATTVDEKLLLELRAVDAQLQALTSELTNAQAELTRGLNLLERGVTTEQNVDGLRTRVEVIQGRIGSTEAQKDVLLQRTAEGRVLAPISGRVIDVPVTAGSVIMPGEMVAVIGGGGFYLRLAVPERHADFLNEGDDIRIDGIEGTDSGTLAKVYPQIENGRVIADVELSGLSAEFIGKRVLVRLPVARTQTVVVPQEAVSTRMGLDFVQVAPPDAPPTERVVVLGEKLQIDGRALVEVLSGLSGDEALVTAHE
ncbi:efflux RND transporter periplasmic adaptor subunit [Ruegeria marina]|uniref:RND family efflux transporter, MFP subunit n=1 Tax=Ruegeria marina TaxID=639004 RepID=A0A1G6X8S5_9RHOB|nr:efflux RND transporter periplasmic adaptor subunit [Ruegeria marina]SDD74534.1 RND family efflux transporter, MFP subunit [Ruegeria marina]